MNSAKKVDALILSLIEEAEAGFISWSEAAWKAAKACVGWAYVFGAHGEYCDPSNRRRWYKPAYPKIKEKCKNFNGSDDKPGGCVGCQWFLGTAQSDPETHEGRTRFFDCRGFVYWILHQVCGMWDTCPAGATTMWNRDSNWKAKGNVSEGVPDDVLVCLFYPDKDDPKKMAHVGFGFRGETVECGLGVEYHEKRNAKWTHWAIPVCVDDPDPHRKPTLRRGDSGEWVTVAQTKLINQGYDCGSTGADGKFGKNTEAAVKRFQLDHGLTADGIIGEKTWNALDGAEPAIYYTVTVPHMTATQADALILQYPGSTKTEERG